MKCRRTNCSGEVTIERIAHTFRSKGVLVVFENVPAKICERCGEVTFEATVVEEMERAASIVPPQTYVRAYDFELARIWKPGPPSHTARVTDSTTASLTLADNGPYKRTEGATAELTAV